MADAVGAHSFHDPPVPSPVQGPVFHMMVTGIMNSADLAFTQDTIVNLKPGKISLSDLLHLRQGSNLANIAEDTALIIRHYPADVPA